MAKKSELTLLREQVKEQRALLWRAQRWVGVAAGVFAAKQPSEEHFSYPWRDAATNALEVGRDISLCLQKYD